jgi:hypothetical protein
MSRATQLKLWLGGVVFLASCAVAATAGESQTPPPTPTATTTDNASTALAPAKSAPQHLHGKKKAPPPPLVLPPLPPGPLQQVPLPQLPESAPKVSFENGQLTIVANNATLGEILKQVKKLTGASIDLPANGAPERVVTQIGPGAPRDVLATLLNGTAFNYVMLGSNSDPTAVASVVLTPKPGSEQVQAAGGNFQQAATPTPGRPQPFVRAAPPQAEVAAADDQSADDAADQGQDADQEQAADQPDQNAQPEQPNPNQPNPNQPNQGPRTPEQLLQMMRQGQQPGAGVPGQPPQQPPPN